jgi:hypothetical protein
VQPPELAHAPLEQKPCAKLAQLAEAPLIGLKDLLAHLQAHSKAL